MQFAVNFGPVLLNRCSKYCSWIGPKLHSSSSCYSSLSGAGQTVEGVVKWMGQHAPVFAVKGNEITVLHEPEQFFNSLKDNVRNAKERIVLASLYLGTGNKEQQLVDCIREAVRQSSSAKQSLDVEILLEHTRGSRGDHNSRTMLLPLVQNFTDTVKVSLYHSPSLRGLLKLLLPERFNETVALTHLKVYLTDNTLIMSGANLSADYFTNRQDRYIEIKNCAALADYFHGLVSTVRSFSFQLQPDNSTVMSKMFPLHPTQGFDRGKKFKVETGKTVLRYLSHQKDENSYNNSISQRKDDQCDTWIVPLVQMFPFGIRQDEFITSELLRSASHSSVICLASGYFNLTRKYIDIMLKSSAKFEILTAHPTVNGFYEAKGVAGGIPHAYTLLLYDFFKLILKHKLDHITVYEYACSGWTFHVKGLWYYLGNKHLPNLTLIGSPNFGHRSVYRDLEAQIAIVTKNQDLRRALHEEKSRLYYKAKCVSKETFELTERKTPFWVYCVTRMMKNFL